MKNKLILKFVICEICKFPNEIITFLKKNDFYFRKEAENVLNLGKHACFIEGFFLP